MNLDDIPSGSLCVLDTNILIYGGDVILIVLKEAQQVGQNDRAPGFDREYSLREAVIRAAMMLDLTLRIKVPPLIALPA